MGCREYEKGISRLIDGEAGESEAEALRRHLEICLTCRGEYERILGLNRVLAVDENYSPPAALATKIKAGLMEENARGRESKFPVAWSRVPLFAVIVLLAIGLGGIAGRSVTGILTGNTLATKLDYLLPDAGDSFSDFVADIAVGENSR